MVLVTTRNRFIFQKHRTGFQGFGGGKHALPLFCRVHSVRREVFMEGNFDVCNLALVGLSAPLLVTQQGDWQWGCQTCLVQIALLRDEEVRTILDGSVWVGGKQMWSRERASKQGWWDCIPNPTQEHVHAGLFFGDEPVVHVVDADWLWRNPQAFRGCDWNTLSMIRSKIEGIIQWHAGLSIHPDLSPARSMSYHFGCTPQWYVEELNELVQAMNEESYLQVLQWRWPLLTTTVLYSTWGFLEWHKKQVFGENDQDTQHQDQEGQAAAPGHAAPGGAGQVGADQDMLQGESMGHEAMQGRQGESADVQAMQHQATQHQGGPQGESADNEAMQRQADQ